MIDPNDLDGREVRFINFATGNGMTLDSHEKNPPDGKNVWSWHLISDTNQRWKLEIKEGKGSETPVFMIKSVKSPSKCLDLHYGDSADNTKITGWQFGSGLNEHQLWYIHTRGNWADKGQIVKIQNHGTKTFVDLYYGRSDNATPIVGWEGSIDSVNDHQLWQIEFMDE
jgi:hypothetical protein